MAANDRVIAAASIASVQASKLSPHVQPFVPRHLQQTEPSSPYVTPRSSHYSPSYHHHHHHANPGYHDQQPHYYPLMSGPYSIQDFQTGYSLYPYPVFMVEEVTPHSSYVSPGTFVCPRAALQPRRTSSKLRFTDHASTTKSGCGSDGIQTRSSSNKSSSSTASSETSDENSVRNGRITNGEAKISRDDKHEEVFNDDNPKCNGSSNPPDRQTNWKQRKLRQTTTEKSSSNEGCEEELKNVEKISNGNSLSSYDHHNHQQIKRETHFPKTKSFADIIKQNSSDKIVVGSRKNSSSVPISAMTKEDEKIKGAGPQQPLSYEKNSEQRSISKNSSHRENNGTNGCGNDGQRWSYVQSKRNHHHHQQQQQQHPQSDHYARNRSSRRSSTSSDANSVHYEKPVQRSSSVRNGKEYDSFKTRSSTLKKHEDSSRVENESRSVMNGVAEIKTDHSSVDNDAWTEVRSNRRFKEPRQNSRKQVHFMNKTTEEVVETNRTAKESLLLTPSSSSSQENDKKPNRLEITSQIKTSSTLCNSKTLKNTENQLEKSRCESRTNNSESLASENEVKTRKKKRKTAGQLKKEFQEKLKTLPAVQGKVLTVSEDFYTQFKQDNTKDNSTINNVLNKKLSKKQFPVLKKKNQVVDGVHDDAIVAATMNLLNLDSDDDWTDVEGNETTIDNSHKGLDEKKNSSSSNCVVDSFPALGTLIEPFVNLDTSYSSLLKKNFWSLPPRITPVENVSTDNRTSLLEKLLAESSQKDLSAFNGQTKGVGGLIKIPDGLSNNVTDCVPIKKVEPKKKPKSNSLIKIYLMNLLKKKQKKKKRSRIHLSSKYANKNPRKVIPYIANILDSTAPRRRRGKEREFPRKKRRSALKKVILKEREEKRSIRASKVVNDKKDKENKVGVVVESTQDDAKESCALSNASCSEDVTAKHLVHSRKFREYCNQMLNPEIDEVAKNLIHDLIRLHDRLYNKNPIKASMNRRLVIGLREVTKSLKQNKLKCLILAPNVERIKSSGGLDEAMYSVIGMAQEQNVPFVFALGRRQLGRVCLKKVAVSCVGIFNCTGSQSNFNRLCKLAAEARIAYQNALSVATNGFESNDGISKDVEGL